MKKTLFFYLSKEIFVPFFLGISVFTFVLLMGRLLKLVNLVVVKGVPLSDVLLMILYLTPSFSIVTIPMAFLLAVLLAFGRLSADNEITAMKACGVGLTSLLPPVLTCALLAYVATTIITVSALPWGNMSFKKLIYNVVESRVNLSIKERVFNDDFPGLVMYLDRYDRLQHAMSGILIHDERNPKEPLTILAKSGVISMNPLTKVLQLHLTNGSIHRSLAGKGYRLVEFQNYELSVDLSRSAKEISRNELDMTFAELRANIRAAQGNSKVKRDMLLEFHRRFSLPFACFVFALVGMPLGIQNQRSGKTSGFTVSLLLILLYYIILSAGKTLGERGLVPPVAAAWIPNVIFMMFGIYLFKRTAAEKRMLLFDLVPLAAKWIRDRLSIGRTYR